MMIPQNLKNYLNILLEEISFPAKEREELFQNIDDRLLAAVLVRIADMIPPEKKDFVSEQLTKLKTNEEISAFANSNLKGIVTKEQIGQIYEEELTLAVDQFIQPFINICTDEQLTKLKTLTNSSRFVQS